MQVKKSILLAVFAFTICAAFVTWGAWTALGLNAEHGSFFSRAGGVAIIALYGWVAKYYIERIRRKDAT